MKNKRVSKKKLVFFATENVNKFNEARKILARYNLIVAMLRKKSREIQDDNIEIIAEENSLITSKINHLPLIVEDAGLFIEKLNGFPGPYSKYVYKTIGTRGILRIMKSVENRTACFRSVVVFSNPDGFSEVFVGETIGIISKESKGLLGFGFDPIFIPAKKKGYTFGEISTREKNKISHRYKAFSKFARWYLSSNFYQDFKF